jgi:hypothetical protein
MSAKRYQREHHHSSIPHVGTYCPPENWGLPPKGKFPREKWFTLPGPLPRRCIHIIQLLLLRPPLNFFTLPSSSPSLLNSSFYSHSYQSPRLLTLLSLPWIPRPSVIILNYSFFTLHSSLLNQFPQSQSSTHEFNRPAYRRAGSTCARGSWSL